MRTRVRIEAVKPQLDGGRYPIKRIVNERVDVTANIFGDGHDTVRAALLYRMAGKKSWEEIFMTPLGNDAWGATFRPDKEGNYEYKIEGWIDHLSNWYNGFLKKYEAGQHMGVELQIGTGFLRKTAEGYSKAKGKTLIDFAKILEDENGYEKAVEAVLSPNFASMVYEFPMKQFMAEMEAPLQLRVGAKKEMFSTWYELFPRSASKVPGKHGTFKDVEERLPRIAEMGFDVLYLPPVHPIGKVNRKGKNNSTIAGPNDPGSPWAIGSDEGGHKALHPELGTLADFKSLIKKAKEFGIDLAMDIAFQCATYHPYIKEHPEWSVWRPDGTIAYAENPPKKYQDIVPLNFESEAWQSLWEELKSVIVYWIEQGVFIFRIDNPHTKPFAFWEWCINEIQKKYPNTIFLAEAFTRPNVMANLAKSGYTQGYSYFTWRTNKAEMQEYMMELSTTEWREFYRPNFWPNTPDILPFELFGAGSNAFVKRVAMAATLSSNYGLYGPAYEFLDNRGNINGKDEYLDSEKYEIKAYNWDHRNRLTDIITRLNQIRKAHPALQYTYNIRFTKTDNDHLMSYVRYTEDMSDIIWCVVNFDTQHTQTGFVEVPVD
ncbi:MAG: alpha-1,4-glucan--maltose-1-phosphate maltosyltransferase, partial [Phaeodactylibacter sp.]|nr:alpha-1,4-glucan--maltose-1-phosphate maltosyltransferase [Phaeodactylibacter sp.]